MKYLIKGVFLFLILNSISISASALGSHTVYAFVLDTSVQNYLVTIDKPVFPTAPYYNFNNYINCSSSASMMPPIKLTGSQKGTYDCTQTSYLNLNSDQSYNLAASIHITAKGRDLIIPAVIYAYDPWGLGTYPVTQITFLIYFDSKGNLNYMPD